MASEGARTVTLTDEQAAFVDRLVERGDYATVDEALRAGVEALQDQDAELEHWLRTEARRDYDEAIADPSLRQPADEVFARLRARRSGGSERQA